MEALMAPMEPTQPARPTPAMPPGRGGRRGIGVMLGLRVLLSMLVGGVGIALLVGGSVLIGGLLLAAAVVRLVMTGLMWSRMRHRRAQVAAWRAGRGWAGPVA
jgi:hypothetical protein